MNLRPGWRYAIMLAALAAAPAGAQQSAPATAPLPEYHFTMSGQEVGVLSRALGTLPYGDVAPLVAKLQGQARQQEQAAADAAKAAPPK